MENYNRRIVQSKLREKKKPYVNSMRVGYLILGIVVAGILFLI